MRGRKPSGWARTQAATAGPPATSSASLTIAVTGPDDGDCSSSTSPDAAPATSTAPTRSIRSPVPPDGGSLASHGMASSPSTGSANASRHPPSSSSPPPSTGPSALNVAVTPASLPSAALRSAPDHSVESRAVASTGRLAAPKPCTTRATIRTVMFGPVRSRSRGRPW